MSILVPESDPTCPVHELRRHSIRLACFEAALRIAVADDGSRVSALLAIVVLFIERGATGSHGNA